VVAGGFVLDTAGLLELEAGVLHADREVFGDAAL
jgi:hypothetical protein